jgi:hypothetical protein
MPATTAATLPARTPLEREVAISLSVGMVAGRAERARLPDILLVFIGMVFPPMTCAAAYCNENFAVKMIGIGIL